MNIRSVIRAFIVTGSLALASAVSPYLEAKTLRDLEVQMMSRGLKELETIEARIKLLPAGAKIAVLMGSAGDLNDRMQQYGKIKIAKGELTKKGYYYIFGTTLMRLSQLAIALGYPDAGLCHSREAQVMFDLSEGDPGAPLNCRSEAYASTPMSEVIGGLDAVSMDNADAISREWTTKTMMLGQDVARLDGRE